MNCVQGDLCLHISLIYMYRVFVEMSLFELMRSTWLKIRGMQINIFLFSPKNVFHEYLLEAPQPEFFNGYPVLPITNEFLRII